MRVSVVCEQCGRVHRMRRFVPPLHCGSCGATTHVSAPSTTQLYPLPSVDLRAIRRPRCNACRHRSTDDCCTLLPEGRNKIDAPRGLPHPAAYCPDEKPQWAGPFVRDRVGFVAVSYQPIGGTEVWHQTLIPRLQGVAGFVALDPTLAGGDFGKLPCTTAVGMEAARQLAACVDTLVVWGAGDRLEQIVERSSPRVISVSHCDNRSDWTMEMMATQAPWTDHNVYICPSGADTCPQSIPSTLIPNAPDPNRVKATAPREITRRDLGVADNEKLIVTISRLSPEKGISKLVRAMDHLPRTYRLAIAGTASGWSADHEAELRSIAGDRVQFLGNVDPPGDLLAAADLFCSPSQYEGYGLSMAEALLAGVPLAATRVGLLEDKPHLARIVRHDAPPKEWAAVIQGTLFDPPQFDRTQIDTVDAFAAAWQQLIDEP